MENLTRENIRQGVQNFSIDYRQRYSNLFSPEALGKMRRAAVMMPMLEIEHQWYLLLTQRSDSLIEHRGQVAFPGGAHETQDENLQQTALRELQEEIGVKPEDVDVFGYLGDLPILTGYLVRLYVGEIPWPYALDICSDEVQSAFNVPLIWLADPKNRKTEYRSYAGREFPVIMFNHYDGYQLWGASAEMTMALLSAINLTH
jgi:8-oxo-dGTP pyrophosphatase MutT (NUDIX family)